MADSWARVQELFQAALEKPPQHRAGFLLQACPDDAEVRVEVESLLAHAVSADSFLEGGPLPGNRDAAPLLSAGQKIDRFEIVEIIGRGGMGEVYRARDSRLRRDIAIKVLRSLRLADADQRRRFTHEAQAASVLSHPNIITIYDTGEAHGVPFIAMEYVVGKTLSALIPPGGLSLQEALGIAIQIAAALERAHAAGIVHRDLKPGNVMITAEGVVKVLDFGVAKLPSLRDEELTGDSITSLGMIVGTADYMSPEQAEGQPLDARSDMFSFGSVLYEMLTGRRPFRSGPGVSTLVSIVTREPPELPASVPRSLREVVARCLRKNRDDRYADMAEVKLALEDIRSHLKRPTPRRSFGYRRRWPMMAIGLSALALCGLLFTFWPGKRKPVLAPHILQFTSYPGSEFHPSFSPDGNEIAFSWNGQEEKNYSIYVKQVGSATALRLTTGTENDLSPAFSPDGRSIGFVRANHDNGTFVTIPALGGHERVISTLTATVPECAFYGCSVFSWFPDGKHVVIRGLELLGIEDGGKRALTAPPNKAVPDECPAVSPDGRAIAFARMPGAQMLDIWVLALRDDLQPRGAPRRLTQQSFNPSPFALDPAWMPDGREVVFSDGRIWRVPVSGGRAPQSVSLEGRNPVLSRLGDKLAYVRFDNNTWEIHRLQLLGEGRATGDSMPFALSTGGDFNPQYSPDGKHVAFETSRTGDERIWISEADGSNAFPLPVNTEMYEGSPRWSPDGKFLTFDSDSMGQWQVYIIPATGGTPKRLTTDSATHNVPTWSRDGKWIYFAGTETGRSEIWKIPSQGGKSIQVTSNGGYEAWEAMDGKTLYFTKDSGGDQGLWRMPLDTSTEQQIAPAIVGWSFAVTRQGLYYVAQPEPGRRPSIQYLSFASDRTLWVANLNRQGEMGLTVSPDGRFLLYVEGAKTNADIMLIENFR